MFTWTEAMIRFFRDASEGSAYFGALAEKIAAHIPQGAHICDAGCGLGYLSLALAERFQNVTSVDISPGALCVLEGAIKARAMDNIHVLCGDIFKLSPQKPYDAMVFCFFGQTAEALRVAREQCCGKAVLIKKNWETHRFDVDGSPLEGFTFTNALRELDALSIPYISETFALELGQPFASLDDALLFFRIYAKKKRPEAVTLEHILPLLQKTNDPVFPYYLPSLKRMGMLVINAEDIPPAIYSTTC